MYPKFRLKNDYYIEFDLAGVKNKIKIADKDQIFEADNDGKYILNSIVGKTILDIDSMKTSIDDKGNLIYDEIINEVLNEDLIDIRIEEVFDNDEEQVKNWRIQLDVKTSRKNLKQLEIFIKENINNFL